MLFTFGLKNLDINWCCSISAIYVWAHLERAKLFRDLNLWIAKYHIILQCVCSFLHCSWNSIIHYDRAKHFSTLLSYRGIKVVLNMARIPENYTCVTLSEGGWIISNSLVWFKCCSLCIQERNESYLTENVMGNGS